MKLDFTIRTYERVKNHLIEFWNGRKYAELRPDSGPIIKSLPRFRLLRFDPTSEKPYWIYSTVGCFEVDSGHNRFEFFLLSVADRKEHELTLKMVANYH